MPFRLPQQASSRGPWFPKTGNSLLDALLSTMLPGNLEDSLMGIAPIGMAMRPFRSQMLPQSPLTDYARMKSGIMLEEWYRLQDALSRVSFKNPRHRDISRRAFDLAEEIDRLVGSSLNAW